MSSGRERERERERELVIRESGECGLPERVIVCVCARVAQERDLWGTSAAFS